MAKGQPMRIEMTGKKCGKLTVRCLAHTTRKKVFWECLCECGKTAVVWGAHLRNGHTRSCGCLAVKKPRHGHTIGRQQSKEYMIWNSMIRRCHHSSDKGFERYGGRGITVCQRWRDSFENFYSDMGQKPPGMSLDRIDNDGNYEPGNVRWATRTQQAYNKRNTKRVLFEGKEWRLCDLVAERSKQPYRKVYMRIHVCGWSVERALIS